jgi:hypothetical protein
MNVNSARILGDDNHCSLSAPRVSSNGNKVQPDSHMIETSLPQTTVSPSSRIVVQPDVLEEDGSAAPGW